MSEERVCTTCGYRCFFEANNIPLEELIKATEKGSLCPWLPDLIAQKKTVIPVKEGVNTSKTTSSGQQIVYQIQEEESSPQEIKEFPDEFIATRDAIRELLAKTRPETNNKNAEGIRRNPIQRVTIPRPPHIPKPSPIESDIYTIEIKPKKKTKAEHKKASEHKIHIPRPDGKRPALSLREYLMHFPLEDEIPENIAGVFDLLLQRIDNLDHYPDDFPDDREKLEFSIKVTELVRSKNLGMHRNDLYKLFQKAQDLWIKNTRGKNREEILPD